jgi:uncharacterized membrane protein YheB (UPF0754 family)
MIRSFIDKKGNLRVFHDPLLPTGEVLSELVSPVNSLGIMARTPEPLSEKIKKFSNKDPEVRRDVTKYFHKDLLSKLKDKNEILALIPGDSVEDKLQYFSKNIFKRLDMFNLLYNYVSKRKRNWKDLETVHKHSVRKYIMKKLKRYLKNKNADNA